MWALYNPFLPAVGRGMGCRAASVFRVAGSQVEENGEEMHPRVWGADRASGDWRGQERVDGRLPQEETVPCKGHFS